MLKLIAYSAKAITIGGWSNAGMMVWVRILFISINSFSSPSLSPKTSKQITFATALVIAIRGSTGRDFPLFSHSCLKNSTSICTSLEIALSAPIFPNPKSLSVYIANRLCSRQSGPCEFNRPLFDRNIQFSLWYNFLYQRN